MSGERRFAGIKTFEELHARFGATEPDGPLSVGEPATLDAWAEHVGDELAGGLAGCPRCGSVAPGAHSCRVAGFHVISVPVLPVDEEAEARFERWLRNRDYGTIEEREALDNLAVPRVSDQPPPRPSTEPPLWPQVIARAHAAGLPDDVIADMRERDQFGRDKYGTALRTGNGRDFAVDLYQELLDACPYAAGAFGLDDPEVAAAMAAVVRIRARLAPCGACHSLRAIGSAVCSRCGATCC